MRLTYGFGRETQVVDAPDQNLIGELGPNPVPPGLTGLAEVMRAMENPIGTGRLRDILRPGEKIALITSDVTRPMPTALVMPPLLDELYAAGISPRDITLVFGLGCHRPQTREEMEKLAGERAFREIRCVDSDGEDCLRLGVTRRGTPVDITRSVAQAQRRICLGNIEYHYFAGYSGGGKALMPGVSTREAIQKNHSLMVDPMACAGRLEGNPIREDIEEAAAMVGCDWILNVVLDEGKRVIHAVAGDAVKAHREGCAFLDRLYLKPLERRADIVLVSQGGAPKDLNLYQTQKALDNAKHAVKQGGVIILIGSCEEGLGERVFEEWMTTMPSPQAMIRRIRQEFELGGHKAAAIAMVLQEADIYLVSRLPAALVERMFLRPFSSAQAALDAALAKLGSGATILSMPYGGSTLPRAQ
ncbi:MAG: nickel-dependent lactate racemase [Candidatus Limiplasma sp.]|nr:nickel-dependent lactate racemase [Candidatus Limiplasma sp.]